MVASLLRRLQDPAEDLCTFAHNGDEMNLLYRSFANNIEPIAQEWTMIFKVAALPYQ